MNIFVLEYEPYNKADGVNNLIGPFVSRPAAETWVESVKLAGGHPDSDWEIVEPVDPGNRLMEIQKENSDSRDESSPEDRGGPDTPICSKCEKPCVKFSLLGEAGYYCSQECFLNSGDTRAGGCRAHELHLGMEFSRDEGRSWLVVKAELDYVDPDGKSTMMRCNAAPPGTTSLSSWEQFEMDDMEHVILQTAVRSEDDPFKQPELDEFEF